MHSFWRMERSLISAVILLNLALSISAIEYNSFPVIRHTRDTNNKNQWNKTLVEILKKELFQNYDPSVVPKHNGGPLDVLISFRVFNVLIDEIASALNTEVWIDLMWRDEKMGWNATEYGGAGILYIPDHQIWSPEIIVLNSFKVNNFGIRRIHILAFKDSWVRWIYPLRFQTFCDLDYRNWPFDTQHCQIKLAASRNGSNRIVMKPTQEAPFEADETFENTGWILNSLNLSKINDALLVYNVTISRRSGLGNLLVAPLAATTIMTLASFWISPTLRVRLFLNVITSFVMLLFLIFFAVNLRASGTDAPYIVIFYERNLHMAMFSTLITLFVAYLSNRTSIIPFNRVVESYLTGQFAKVLLLNSVPNQKPNSDSHKNGRQILEEESNKWIILATLVDRISFILYFLIFMSFAFTYLS